MFNYNALLKDAVESRQEVTIEPFAAGVSEATSLPPTRANQACQSLSSVTLHTGGNPQLSNLQGIAVADTNPQALMVQPPSAPGLLVPAQAGIDGGPPQLGAAFFDPLSQLRQQTMQMNAFTNHANATRRFHKEQQRQQLEEEIRRSYFELEWIPLHSLARRPPAGAVIGGLGMPDDMLQLATYLAKQTGQDTCAALFCILGSMSIAMRGRYLIQIGDGWQEPAVDYLLLLSPSGSRKTQLISLVRKPFDEFIVNLQQIRSNATKLNVLDKIKRKKLGKLVDQAASHQLREAMRDGRTPTMEELERILEPYAGFVEGDAAPSMPRLFVDVATLKKLPFALEAQGGCLSFLEAEGGFLVDCLARKGSDCTLFLKAHTMEDYAYESATLGSAHVPRPALPMLFFVQPSVLSDLLRNKSLDDRGALARFLPYFCSPEATPPRSLGEHLALGVSSDDASYIAYGKKLSAMLEANYTQDCNRSIWEICVSPEAYDLAKGFEDEVAHILKAGVPPSVKPFLHKLHGSAVRLAGDVHAWNYAEPHHHLITAQEMRAGIGLARILGDHAMVAFDAENANACSNAERIVAWIRRNNFQGDFPNFTSRDVEQGLRRLNKASAHAALDYLEQRNYLRQIHIPGRSPICVVNPRVFNIAIRP